MQDADDSVNQGYGRVGDSTAADVLGYAHWQVSNEDDGQGLPGSCTACVGVMKPGGILQVTSVACLAAVPVLRWSMCSLGCSAYP